MAHITLSNLEMLVDLSMIALQKGDEHVCGCHRGVRLLIIPGKVYGRPVTERLRIQTEEKHISEEQCRRMCGRGCVDQIFSVTQVMEKYLVKNKKLYGFEKGMCSRG